MGASKVRVTINSNSNLRFLRICTSVAAAQSLINMSNNPSRGGSSVNGSAGGS